MRRELGGRRLSGRIRVRAPTEEVREDLRAEFDAVEGWKGKLYAKVGPLEQGFVHDRW
jgi:hypothetical protein